LCIQWLFTPNFSVRYQRGSGFGPIHLDHSACPSVVSVFSESVSDASKEGFLESREEFISQWGAIGTSWGINRTVAKIHALLMTSQELLSTDEVMDCLSISRGNANTSLRELVSWGLIRPVVKPGERKEFFEAEKDIYKMACIIARERKRREIEPAMAVVKNCQERTDGDTDPEALAFNKQMGEMMEFMQFASTMLDKVAGSKEGTMMKMAAKFLA